MPCAARTLAAGQRSAKFFYKSIGCYHARFGAANELWKADTIHRHVIIVGDQPDEFAAFIKSEIATLGKIIKQTGATVE